MKICTDVLIFRYFYALRTNLWLLAGFTIADLMKGSLALNLSERSLISTTATLEGVKQESTIFVDYLKSNKTLRQNYIFSAQPFIIYIAGRFKFTEQSKSDTIDMSSDSAPRAEHKYTKIFSRSRVWREI